MIRIIKLSVEPEIGLPNSDSDKFDGTRDVPTEFLVDS